MQQQRKDGNLTDADASRALEILKGYGANTIRQNPGKIKITKTVDNLKTIDNILTELKLTIERELKEPKSHESSDK